MLALQRKSVSTTSGDKKYQVTYTQGETVKIDEDHLRKAVGVKIWNAITDRKVNRTKLTEEISKGSISPEVVSTWTSVQQNKPYLRFTEKPVSDDEEASEE